MVRRAREITAKPIGVNLLLFGNEQLLEDVLREEPAVDKTAGSSRRTSSRSCSLPKSRRLTPIGFAVISRARRTMARTSYEASHDAPITPRPPASDTSMARTSSEASHDAPITPRPPASDT